ncbi:nitrous oxide reductase accessory protein NosL [Alteribacillus sp. YIM 98480]|uniref:nitrous oxide reductase accessory protein NosL n=1 Tax=Alteribacillus sp. YIM 98480 TaxID=2606599 RepID=UPI001E3032AF|nr:nitrous oxide reductase accessory protein NosL [Alteribacillus sp. YIM 98480]
MTVYRDLKPLIQQKKIVKTSSGIALWTSMETAPPAGCPYCQKEATGRLGVQIIKENRQVESACCAHCALLRYQNIKDEVVQITCRDFLKNKTISAKVATYLIDADLDLNCCEPQPIVFSSRNQAEQFQKGFGGKVYNFQEAMHVINAKMSGNSCSCNRSGGE